MPYSCAAYGRKAQQASSVELPGAQLDKKMAIQNGPSTPTVGEVSFLVYLLIWMLADL